MKPNKDMLEDRLEGYEEELKGLNSYLQELKTTTTNLGTDHEQFEDDLMEAEQNIGYYQGEIAGIKAELGEPAKPAPGKPGPGIILPQTARQGIGSVVFSSISFIVGALLGSRLKSRKDSKDSD
jgi:hypothetical protein